MKGKPVSDKILGYECKHVTYVKSQADGFNDAVFVKEQIHNTDGTVVPNLRMIKNPQREFYITREGHRNHKDKKESEKLSKLQKFPTNQRMMTRKIAKALGRGTKNLNLKQLARSQYLYGADIGIEALTKKKYLDRFQEMNLSTKSRVAVLDIETDVLHGTEQILSVAVTSKENVFLSVNEWFLDGMVNPEEKIRKAMDKYLGEYVEKRNIKLEVAICKTPGECVAKAMEFSHRIKPDFMAIWNINFDLPRLINALEHEGYNVADVMSDPSVPPEFRYAKYIESPKVRVTASERNMPVPMQERWHKFICPSSFYWVDAMVTYAMIRKAGGMEPSYKLDYILNKELGIRKLHFKEADHVSGLDEHIFMQRNYKIEYLIYNVFDCISVEELDEKTNDLAITLGELCDFSSMNDFNSTPTQLADDLHYFYLDRGEVISTKSDKMEDELDQYVISMKDHIVTLATHHNAETGVKPFKDFPELRTLIRRYVADLDVKSAYPYTEIFLNISRKETRLELCDIKGVSEADRRIVGLNLTGGKVNHVEFCTRILNAPELDELAVAYMKEKQNVQDENSIAA